MAGRKVEYTIHGKDRSKKATNSAAKNLETLAKAAKLAAIGMIAHLAKVTFKKITSEITELIDLYGEQEKVELRLTAAAINNPYINGDGVNSLKDYASALQEVSIYGDEAIIQQASFLTTLQLQEQQIKDVLAAAVDLASTGIITFESAVKNLAKTYAGTTGELGKLIPSLRKLTTEQLETGEAIKLVAKQYDGMAEAAASGIDGTRTQINNLKGDIKELFGAMLSPALKTALNSLKPVLESIRDWADENKEKIADYIDSALGDLIFTFNFIKDLIKEVFKTNDHQTAWKLLTSFMGTLMVQTLNDIAKLVFVIAGVMWEPIKTKFQQIMWDIEHVAETVMDKINAKLYPDSVTHVKLIEKLTKAFNREDDTQKQLLIKAVVEANARLSEGEINLRVFDAVRKFDELKKTGGPGGFDAGYQALMLPFGEKIAEDTRPEMRSIDDFVTKLERVINSVNFGDNVDVALTESGISPSIQNVTGGKSFESLLAEDRKSREKVKVEVEVESKEVEKVFDTHKGWLSKIMDFFNLNEEKVREFLGQAITRQEELLKEQLLAAETGKKYNDSVNAALNYVDSWDEPESLPPTPASIPTEEDFNVVSMLKDAFGAESSVGGVGGSIGGFGGGVGLGGIGDMLGPLMGALGPVVGLFLELMGSLQNVAAIFNWVGTIVGAAMDLLGPVINSILAPLVGGLKLIGMVLGALLIPVFQSLVPVIEIIAKAFFWLYDFAIKPLANLIITIMTTLNNAVIDIVNAMIKGVNKLKIFGQTSLIKKTKLGDNLLQDMVYEDMVDMGQTGETKESSSDSFGAGASYTGAPTNNFYVTMNADVVAGDDGIDTFIMMFFKRANELAELGHINTAI